MPVSSLDKCAVSVKKSPGYTANQMLTLKSSAVFDGGNLLLFMCPMSEKVLWLLKHHEERIKMGNDGRKMALDYDLNHIKNNMKFFLTPLILSLMLLITNCTGTEGLNMVAEKINKLINCGFLKIIFSAYIIKNGRRFNATCSLWRPRYLSHW